MELSTEIYNELTNAVLNIEVIHEGNNVELVKYNSYHQSDYIQHIDDLFEKFKKDITNKLFDNEFEKFEYINLLVLELESMSSFFLKRNGLLMHLNLIKTFYDPENYDYRVLKDDEYIEEINMFVSYQNQLYKKLISYLKILKARMSEVMPDAKYEKIKWKGKVSQFGYIFLELINKGYIQPPRKSGGEINYAKFARNCFDVFEIDTTLASLSKELSEKQNSLDRYNKNQFEIPYEQKLIIPDRESIS